MHTEIFSKLNITAKNSLCVRKIPGKRETWRVSDSENTYYIKILLQNSLFRKLITALKLSKLQKEIRAFHVLKAKGILTPELIDHGYQYGALRLPNREYFITREVENGLRLKDFYFDKFQYLSRKDQKQIISDFACYIRRLHDSGITHLDPHLGNFLIKQEKNGKNQFYILDLADTKVKETLNFNERWNNLALINLSFLKTLPAELRYYFFKNYVHGLLFKKIDVVHAAKFIEARTLNFAKKASTRRIKWCMGNNSYFSSFQIGRLKVHAKKDCLHDKLIEQVLSSPDVFLDKTKGVILKDGRTVKAARIDAGDGRSIFLKRYNRKDWLHTFKNIFRRSRANRVWKISWELELRRIPSPLSLIYLEERSFGVLKRSYIISEFIEGAEMLSVLFGQCKLNLSSEQKLSIMRNVGREIGRMHALGYIHGDLKWSNILVKKTGIDFNCFFVDLDGSRAKKILFFTEIIGELSRFYVEMLKYHIRHEDQNVFLKSYLKHNHLTIPPEILVEKIMKKARIKSSRHSI